MIAALPKALPHSDESERAVLGSALIDARCLDEIDLLPDDMYGERHQILLRTFLSLHARGLPVDVRTVQAELEAEGVLDMVGGVPYLTGLDLDLPDWNRAPAYAAIVKERSRRRLAIQIAGAVIRDALAGEPLPEILGQAAHGLDALVSNDKGAGYVGAREWVERLDAHIDQPGGITGCTTGLPTIDDAIVAMEPGQLWIVGARPMVGKTSFMLQIALREAMKFQRRVGIVSLEMTGLELMMRMAARESDVPFGRIRRRALGAFDRRCVTDAMNKLHGAPMAIDDGAGQSVHEIVSRARALHRNGAVSTIIVDYLTLIGHAGLLATRQDLKIAELTGALAGLAKNLPATVILLAQLGKKSEHEKRKPVLADLKDGGEQDAYGVLLLHREPSETNPSLLSEKGSVILAKNRGGATCEVPALFDGPRMTWRETTDRTEPEKP